MALGKGTAAAIGRSLRIYHGDAERAARMDRLNALFLKPGGLAFDIGAHVGDRVSSFRRLGARVVALEPQPGAMRALRLIHGRDPAVTLVAKAAGSAAGRLAFHINSRNPTVSTASPDFISASRGAMGWEGQEWDGTIFVETTTLDALIAEHGCPDLLKIDVEGFEDAVLAGLSKAPPALSFEFTTIQKNVALSCLDRLAALGPYRFNFSLGESHRLEWPAWRPAAAIGEAIDALPPEANSGDVHACIEPPGSSEPE